MIFMFIMGSVVLVFLFSMGRDSFFVIVFVTGEDDKKVGVGLT